MSAGKSKRDDPRRRIEKLRAELAELEAGLAAASGPAQAGAPDEAPSGAPSASHAVSQFLKELQHEYGVLFAGITDAGLVIDIESLQIVDCNDRAVDLFGYAREELLSLKITELSAEPEASTRALREQKGGGSGFAPLRHYRCKDGTIIPIEIAGGSFIYGGHRYACAACRDLRPRLRGEAGLRELAERLKVLRAIDEAILDSRPVAEIATMVLEQVRRSIPCRRACVVEFNAERNTAVIPASLCDESTRFGAGTTLRIEEFGVPPELSRGRERVVERLEITPQSLPFERALHFEGVRAMINLPILYRTRLVGALNISFGEAAVVGPDALEIARELAGRLAIAFQRRRAEQALQESEAWHRAIFDGSREPMFVLNWRGVFVDSNPAANALTGREAGALHGRSIGEVFAGDAAALAALWERVARGEVTLVECRIEPGDAPAAEIELSFSALEAGEGLHLLGVARDVTARKEAEANRAKLETQIQHTQKLESLGVLAGGIAHDFNNLLTGIMGNASLALLNLSPTAPARGNLEQIEIGAQRAADLCKQMLAYSGRGKFVVEALDVSRVVEEMAHLLEVSISKKAVLKYRLEPSLPRIEADVTQIRQVVMNLITNASDAIGDRSGMITLSTGALHCDRDYLKSTYIVTSDLPEGGYVYVEVSDTGHGMDKTTMARIFEPFYTTKFTGRGLGLAAVLGIVRGHKGALKVYSEPGRGTTFKVFFPFSDKTVHEPANTQLTGPSGLRGSGTILVVDDEDTVRALAIHTLETFGYKVLAASDGQQAVNIFRETPTGIDLVLLDLTMPHMGGEEAFRELRQLNPEVRVLLSSGYTEQEATDRFAGKNLAGFIQKPYRAMDLVEKVAGALEA